MQLPPVKVSESQIQRAVFQHLRLRALPDVVAYHPANGGQRSKAEAGRFRAEGVTPGIPDVALVIGGSAYFLELKTAKGRLSPVQVDMHQRLVRARAEVAVAHSLDDAIAQLVRWGAMR